MKFSPILKGLAISVALFALVSEASAQLPVRTRTLQLVGSTSGTLSQNADAVTTSYTVTWPAASAHTTPLAGEQYFLRSSFGAGNATQTTLSWFAVTGDLVDNFNGSGLAGQVTFWQDNNSITGETGFLWSAANNTLTIGQTGETAEIVFTNGTQTGTFQTAALTSNHTYNLPNITGAGPFALNIPVSTNLPDLVAPDQILLSNIVGSARWATNPFAGVERGLADPTDGAYSYAVTGLTATPDGTDLLIVSSVDITLTPTGNILAVTAVGANQFTVSSTGPFTGTERIAWLFIPLP